MFIITLLLTKSQLFFTKTKKVVDKKRTECYYSIVDKKETWNRGDKVTNTEKLKYKIKISGYKLSHLAGEMSITRQGLFNKINNRTDFTVEEMKKLSVLLKLKDCEMKEIFLSNK